MAADPGIEARKQALRRQARGARAALSRAERRESSARVAEHLGRHEEILAARVVAAYAATGMEVDVDPLLSRLLASGTTLLVPWVSGGDVHLSSVADLETDLVAGYRGVREPRPALRRPVAASTAQVLLVPGVAFDRGGRRLGAGGGHLDRLLATAGSGPLRVGVAFAAQLVEHVPTEPHDERVHLVVTEDGVVDTRRG